MIRKEKEIGETGKSSTCRRWDFRATREHLSGGRQFADSLGIAAWDCGICFAHRRVLDYKKGRLTEHDVIKYCKARLEEKVVHAIGIIIKEIRAEERMSE